MQRERLAAQGLHQQLAVANSRIEELERQIETEAEEYADLSLILEETRNALDEATRRVEKIPHLEAALDDAKKRERELQAALQESQTDQRSTETERDALLERLRLESLDLEATRQELNTLEERFRALAVRAMARDNTGDGSTCLIRLDNDTPVP